MPSGRIPSRAPLDGTSVRLEPIDPALHAPELFAAAAGADELWRFMGYGPWTDLAPFRSWLADCAAAHDPIFYAIRERTSGKVQGMASYLNIVPKNGSIEIGHIWFAPALQKTRAATEALVLLMRHAMDELRYRRLEWKCNALNDASRRAARRLGLRFEGIFHQHMIIKGRNRDTAWYSIMDHEWPAVRAALDTWLDPANFDEAGRQRRSLTEMTGNGA